ncbi:DJ-1/PfpI family protein [Shimia isoporae]|uniref:DJ-1/PfpI family protein n=1 Tax=Shimia isoporae TaxID=647720 RepID=A0A4R1N8Z8_9RHOB|nr:DJ-1/PfpI family protein [Shimia isoporae]TCL01584.1 DJ-1/PfpI family protein [Shimia isoporae]
MRTIGAVIFDGFEMLDYFGPLEMFSMFRDQFEVKAVGETGRSAKSSGGPSVVPDATFADGTAYDILLVPGGKGTRVEVDNGAMLDWLRAASAEAQVVTSVCTGSALLARAGLLDGRAATTNKLAFDWVCEISKTETVDWRRSARWVKDGKFYTSSGVSAGTDMSLQVIADLLGDDAAKQAAVWAEYEANRDANNDPFAVGEG